MADSTDIATGANLAAYLIAGDDEYLISDALTKLLRGVDQASVSEFDPTDDIEMLYQALLTPPMFEDRRFVVLKEADRLPAEAQRQLISFLDDPTPSTTLILVASKASQSLVSSVRRAGRVIDAVKGKRPDLYSWLKQQFARNGLSAAGEALAALVEAVGEERTALSQAVDELTLAVPKGTRLSANQIARHFRGHADVKLYAFVDAVAQRQPGDALQSLHYLLARGEPPQMLFWSLARHFRMLLLAAQGPASSVADQLRLPQWRAEKLVRQARLFRTEELVAAYQRLAEADLKMKRSEEPESLTLERAVVAIASR
ncbi:MAG: DNA polymerase III subunit delta [Actinomycetota bacterium]|nr:DNA polymerase III subunit delta [Actinomycetota bacterium]